MSERRASDLLRDLRDDAETDIRRVRCSVVQPQTLLALIECAEALSRLVARCDGDEGVQTDGSNIDTREAHAALAKLEAL